MENSVADPAGAELAPVVEDRDDRAQIHLVALLWRDRGELCEIACQEHTEHTPRYVPGTPRSAERLLAGPDRLRRDCAEWPARTELRHGDVDGRRGGSTAFGVPSLSAKGATMKTTGISSVDHAPQVVAEWLDALCEDLGWQEKGRAWLLLRAVLHAVRDYLGADEAADLAAQLPVLIRGMYFEGWVPSRTPAHPRQKADFIARVQAAFAKEPLEDPDSAVSAVLALLGSKVSHGEFREVAHAMQTPLRDLFV